MNKHEHDTVCASACFYHTQQFATVPYTVHRCQSNHHFQRRSLAHGNRHHEGRESLNCHASYGIYSKPFLNSAAGEHLGSQLHLLGFPITPYTLGSQEDLTGPLLHLDQHLFSLLDRTPHLFDAQALENEATERSMGMPHDSDAPVLSLRIAYNDYDTRQPTPLFDYSLTLHR